jgi:hypothetical protein
VPPPGAASPEAPPPARLECPAGRGDCDLDPTNGCEADLSHDADNCHVCGHSCRGEHATEGCFDGVCRILGCEHEWGDCDHVAENGCETHLCYTSHGWQCQARCGGYGYEW